MVINECESKKIQLLRGLAIIAVVLIHNTPSGLAQVWCRPFINFSVACFLFLSGLLSNVDKWNPNKRIKKVIIPYIIWTLIYTVINNIKRTSLQQMPLLFLKLLFNGKAAAIMYYIFVYCEFSLLIPTIDKLSKSKWKYIGFLISPLEIVIFRLLPLIGVYNTNEYIDAIKHISCLGWFTYFYLGYMLGNNRIKYTYSTVKLTILWCISIILQILEGYWYLSMGEKNCGTQLKLTAIISGSVLMLIVYRFIKSEYLPKNKWLTLLGDYSFGIFFSHLAVMSVLNKLPFYSQYVVYPINAIVAIITCLICVFIGKKILGKYSTYLAL